MTETAKKHLSLWAEEVHKEYLGLRFRLHKTLFSGQSPFQQIDVVDSVGFGRMLFNDGVVMISERDEFVYHEMISHVPLFVHPGVRRALVIGGGDGGTVREILRHDSVEHCRLVEIDPVVVEQCRKHIPQTAAALDDPRAEVTVADGVEFMAKTDELYDLIVIDSTDPVGPAMPLFGTEFYENVAKRVTENGIVISQAESPYYEPEWQRRLTGILGECFGRVQIYNYVNLTYPGALWSFTFASNGSLCPIGDFDHKRAESSGIEFQYYNADVHRAAFALPTFQRKNLEGRLTEVKS